MNINDAKNAILVGEFVLDEIHLKKTEGLEDKQTNSSLHRKIRKNKTEN